MQCKPVIGEKKPVVSHRSMNQLSLRNNGLKLETTGKLPIFLEESIEYTQFDKGKPEDVNT